MDRPPRGRRIAAVVIDLALVFVVGPVLMVALGVAISGLVYLPVRGDCPDPCDGSGMIGFSLAAFAYFAAALLYWPVLVYRRRRTVGARLAGLRYEGRGAVPRLVWDLARAAGAAARVQEPCDRPPR